MKKPSPGSIECFQAGPYVKLRRHGLATKIEIVPPVHAKRFGSRQTACGLAADTWVESWSTPFEDQASGMCADCARVLTAET